MNGNETIAVNGTLMTNRVADISAKITSINSCLTKICELVNSNDFGIGGDLDLNINLFFQKITDNFPYIINNLEVIVSELIACQSNYRIEEQSISAMLHKKNLD